MRSSSSLLLAALLLVPSLAWADITATPVQETTSACAITTVNTSLPGAVTAGNLVIAAVIMQSASQTITVSNNGDVDLGGVGHNTLATDGSGDALRVYQFWAVGGTDSTYTFTASGSATICVWVGEFASGAGATNFAVDTSCSGENPGGTTHACGAAGSQTTGGLVISAIRSTTAAAWTQGTGYTRRDGVAGPNGNWDSDRSAVESRSNASPGTTFDGAFTSSASEVTFLLAVSYKEAAANVRRGSFGQGFFGQ